VIERGDGNGDDRETDRDADPAAAEAADDRLREGLRCCQGDNRSVESNRDGKLPPICNSIVTGAVESDNGVPRPSHE